MTTHHARRIFVAVTSLSLVLSIGNLASGSDAVTGTTAGDTTAGSSNGGERPGMSPQAYVVTLLTGDRVMVARDKAGLSVTRIEKATRSDGSRPAVQVQRTGDTIYVIPDDARPLIATGQLDEELFNVTTLAESGFTDNERNDLPVILEYKQKANEGHLVDQTKQLPGTSKSVRGLGSINGTGVGLKWAELGGFWAQLNPQSSPRVHGRPTSSPSLGAGVKKVWLDQKVTVYLNESVPLIGAPEAWGAGFDGRGAKVAVLDTGIDETHPDFAGKVIASKSFITNEDVADGHGHGTHVASTIAGSGAASGGKYKGVAPGASLIVGKVLANSGSGSMSGIVDGMEWATIDEGADVVSMSFGCDACPADGSEPQDQAVNQLSEQTGALFVIAAGNSGPWSQSVSSPGSADDALTVAAVSKSDQLAAFSGRGPRRGDLALKPEIAAPGVAITAARAAGTALGPIVDEKYTTISGTSMATPHVAGAAAILAQQHPDWRASQLKAALMSTAKDDGYSVYEQGAGRVDVARAARQTVFATTAKLDYKNVVPPTDAAVTKAITYANLGDQPVTLDLSARVGSKGGPSPDGTLTVSPAALIIPAGGTAEATVALSPPDDWAGVYSGAVVATGPDNTRLSTPVGFTEFSELTVTLSRRQKGADPVTGTQCASITVYGVDGGAEEVWRGKELCWSEPAPPEHSVTYTLPGGTYFAVARTQWHSSTGVQTAIVVNPEFPVKKGVSQITLDADAAKPISFDTPRPSHLDGGTFVFERTSTGGRPLLSMYESEDLDSTVQWVTPTKAVTKGSFVVAPMWLLGGPPVTGGQPGEDEYYYVLNPYTNSVANPPRYSFSRSQLADVKNYLHADRGNTHPAQLEVYNYRESGLTRIKQLVQMLPQVTAPRVVHIYTGPLYPDMKQLLQYGVPDLSFNTFLNGAGLETGFHHFDKPIQYPVHWGERPVVPGPVLTPADARPTALYDEMLWNYQVIGCAACRADNIFYGLMQLTAPDGRHATGYIGASHSGRPDDSPRDEPDPGLHLFRDGQEILGERYYPCDGVHYKCTIHN